MGNVESRFQGRIIRELRQMFPGCIIMKGDANYLQGIPDIIILWGDTWAALECKTSEIAVHGPNQDYYVGLMSGMSFAAFIHPGNKELVLNDLQRALESNRAARVLGSQ